MYLWGGGSGSAASENTCSSWRQGRRAGPPQLAGKTDPPLTCLEIPVPSGPTGQIPRSAQSLSPDRALGERVGPGVALLN